MWNDRIANLGTFWNTKCLVLIKYFSCSLAQQKACQKVAGMAKVAMAEQKLHSDKRWGPDHGSSGVSPQYSLWYVRLYSTRLTIQSPWCRVSNQPAKTVPVAKSLQVLNALRGIAISLQWCIVTCDRLAVEQKVHWWCRTHARNFLGFPRLTRGCYTKVLTLCWLPPRNRMALL